MSATRPTQAIIHLSALEHNFQLIKKMSPGVLYCPAVKAQAYGHGGVAIARTLKDLGAQALAVAVVSEGLELRQAGVQGPIVILGAVLEEEISQGVECDLQPFVFTQHQIDLWAKEAKFQKKTIKVHLKIDSGMGRIGCTPQEAPALARQIVLSGSLELEGLSTHFAASDGPGPVSVEQQLKVFQEAQQALEAEGCKPRIIHASNSGAIIDFPKARFNMVRPGIILYGYPSLDQKAENLEFKPVMELVSRVVFVKSVPAGTGISYGSRYLTSQATRIATIPIGYADGWKRSFINKARVDIAGQTYKVSGTVCMDQFMVDVGPQSKVAERDPVILFGDPKEGKPSLRDLAALAGTITYEVLCGISPRVPRVYQP